VPKDRAIRGQRRRGSGVSRSMLSMANNLQKAALCEGKEPAEPIV
jgi:hypothetical protein